MEDVVTVEQLRERIGRELGVSDWMKVDQRRINAFADATEDHQFIHVDPERARQTPFGTTIAHGLLTLSLIVKLCMPYVPKLRDTRLLLNYGFDRVRFPAPVPVNSRIRARLTLDSVEERSPGQLLVQLGVVVEVENGRRPALVAEWLSLHVIG